MGSLADRIGTSKTHNLEVGRAYWIKWRCRDIGFRVERGSDEYVYRGRATSSSMIFDPVGGGNTIWLFDDEVIYAESDR